MAVMTGVVSEEQWISDWVNEPLDIRSFRHGYECQFPDQGGKESPWQADIEAHLRNYRRQAEEIRRKEEADEKVRREIAEVEKKLRMVEEAKARDAAKLAENDAFGLF